MLPSKSRQGGGTGSCEPSPTPSRKSSTTSPPTMRRPSLTSPPQRPSRLPVVSQYPRPLSPPTSPQQSLRPRRFTPPLPPSPDQEQREPLTRGVTSKYTRKNSMSPNNSLVCGIKVLGSKRPASPSRPTNPKRVGSPKRGEVSRRQVSSPVLTKRGPVPRVPSPVLPNKRGPSPSHARRRSPSQARSVCIKLGFFPTQILSPVFSFSALRVPEVEGAGPQVQEVDPSAETPHQGKNIFDPHSMKIFQHSARVTLMITYALDF